MSLLTVKKRKIRPVGDIFKKLSEALLLTKAILDYSGGARHALCEKLRNVILQNSTCVKYVCIAVK